MRTAQVLNLPGTEASLRLEIDRLKHQLQVIQLKVDELMITQQQKNDKTISVYVSSGYRLVHISEIIMIRSMGNYSTFFLYGGERILTSRTLKYWETQCGSEDLVRVHNSYLIHKGKIAAIQPDQCTIAMQGGLTAQYTRRSKTLLLGLLGHSKQQTQKAKSPKFALHPKS